MKQLSRVIRAHSRALAVTATTVALLIGFLAGLPHDAPPPVFAAACQNAHGGCAGGDTTRTAMVDVLHQASGTTWVEPNTGETWDITVSWNIAGFGNCPAPTVQVGGVTVDWNGSGWTLSNKVMPAGIVDIQVCDISGTCASTTGPRAYRLKVDITDPFSGPNNLQSVVFTTTAVDDGFTIDNSDCSTTTTTVTPTSQTFTATDNGGFECDFACANITGPAVTITY